MTAIAERFPRNPYCSNALDWGLKIRSLAVALKYRYIQYNPPGITVALVFDLDYPTWTFVAEDCGLPQPTWVAGNCENGHAHLVYLLKFPVTTTFQSHRNPMKYAAAIEEAMRERLGADPMYAGLITKNPMRPDAWRVEYNGDVTFTLDDLAAYVQEELSAPRPRKRPLTEVAGLGRNCYIFETVRQWAYVAIRSHWNDPTWDNMVYDKCAAVNCTLSIPLYGPEVTCIARSIAKWTRLNITEEGFSEYQRQCSRKFWGPSQKESGLEMLRIGVDVKNVAAACGVSISTAYLWKAEAEPEPHSITNLKPWEAEGISRATWYRKSKEIV